MTNSKGFRSWLRRSLQPTYRTAKAGQRVFVQTFLRRAQQNCPYFMGTDPGQLMKQAGTSTIKWRRIEQETPTTTALTELTTTSSWMQGRDADTPTFTDVTATVAKYGQFYIVNEEVDLYNPNGTPTSWSRCSARPPAAR
jgi:hypothetical protein